jgi:hypothetical protein
MELSTGVNVQGGGQRTLRDGYEMMKELDAEILSCVDDFGYHQSDEDSLTKKARIAEVLPLSHLPFFVS